MASDDEPHRRVRFLLGIDRLGLVALRAPLLAAFVIVALTGLAVMGLLRIKVDDSLSELFRTSTTEFRQYEEVDRRFPSSEYDVLVVVEGRDLLKRPQIEAFQKTTTELQLLDGVDGLVSMLSARGRPDAKGYAPPIVPDDVPAQGPEFDRTIEALRKNEIVAGKFLSDDGTLALIVISLDRKAVEEQSARVIIGGIRDGQAKAAGAPRVAGGCVEDREVEFGIQRGRRAVRQRDRAPLLRHPHVEEVDECAQPAALRLQAEHRRLVHVLHQVA